MVPSLLQISCLVPLEEKHPKSMIFPPPFFSKIKKTSRTNQKTKKKKTKIMCSKKSQKCNRKQTCGKSIQKSRFFLYSDTWHLPSPPGCVVAPEIHGLSVF